MSTIEDGLSRDIGIGKQIVDLFASIKGLGLKRPKPNEQKEGSKELNQYLGEWAAEAYSKKRKTWLRPVLRTAPFLEHLRRTGGYCEPEGECAASFDWAKLLYALNIRPGQGVVSWESLPHGFDPVASKSLHLDMEGPVFWHIINLYRWYDVSDPRDKNETAKYRLSFGTISYRVEAKGRFIITFEPGEMTSLKQPFRWDPPDAATYFDEDTGYLPFNRDDLMTLYLKNTLKDGISDPTLRLLNPFTEEGDNTPLENRIKELVRILKVLRERRDPPTSNPFLVTEKWLRQATRIYQRATSDGAIQSNLPEYMVTAFEKHAKSTTIDSLNERFGKSAQSYSWRTQAEELLQSRCMLPNQSLHLVWQAENKAESTSRVKDEISQLLREEFDAIMTAFKNSPKNSLMQTLAKVPEEAKYLLAYPRGQQIQNKPVIVLQFTPVDEDWNAECQVQSSKSFT
ncbi:hypothetical protein BX600DRAFT_457185 [Xylariales sp. PMI_506]|nr:hypothetical protein BX600DRAFT_457185 [Xylariales sp. PMI_506]